jgi:endonuclease-3 related protein
MIKQAEITRRRHSWPERVYKRLLRRFGPQGWWPGDSRVEIVAGAVLVQNTNWRNVEKALNNLKRALLLDFKRLLEMKRETLEELIRPAGCYRVKAARLRNLLTMLNNYHPWESFFAQGLAPARERLLEVSGVGRETADAILLYAGGKATFVADAYTLRVLSRHGLPEAGADYESARAFFMQCLPADEKLLGEFHALILALAKTFCLKRQPRCAECPLHEEEFFLASML